MRRVALIALAALVVVLIASIAAGRSVIGSSPPPSGPSAGAPGPAPTEPPLPDGFTAFTDTGEGYSIAYPAGWTRLRAPDPQVRLLVADGKQVSLLIRVAPLGLEVTPQTLDIARDLTDKLVRADQRVKLLSQPEPITLDGLPGYRYLYTFMGPDGSGAHEHLFLFDRGRLISLVFQLPSATALERRSGMLDHVAGTFRLRK